MEAPRPADPRKVGGYQVLARLGSGAMGQVYLGRSAGGRPVAIKVVHAALAGDRDFRARFAREVAAARAVSGAFTAPVIDADPDAPSPWLVTAYLPGYSLQQVVDGSGPLPAGSVSALGAGLAEALVSIHRAGVVHRDLKPSNVLVTPEGPRVIDFGIARAAEVSAVTRTGVTVGSPGYLSPEQATGAESGPAGDVFSLGAVLTYAATGHGPFGHGAVHDLLYRVVHEPPWLDPIGDPNLRGLLAACLDKDPARRPGTGDVLERLAAAAPAAPYGVGWLPPPVAHQITTPVPLPATRPGISRRRVLYGVAGAGVAGAAVLAGGVALLAGRGKGAPDGTWTFVPESNEVTGGPILSGGLLFATVDFHANGLVALDPRTGALRWSTVDVKAPGAATPLRVVTVGRTVYACGGTGFKAINAANGDSLWSAPSHLITLDLVPVVGGGLLFGSGATPEVGLSAYDVTTGQRRWAFNTGDELGANPVLAGGTIYATTGSGTVFGVDAASGQAKWRHSLAKADSIAPVSTPPAVGGGLVHVVTGDDLVYGLDAADGSQKWKATAGVTNGEGAEVALSLAGDTVYVTGENGGMTAFGASDGKTRWRHAFKGTGRDASALLPVVNNGLAYCYDDDTLFALDVATGKVRWQVGGLDGTYQFPVLAAGAVHLSSLSAVVSLDPATGRVLRRHPAEMGEDLTASAEFLYWRDATKVYAAKIKS